MNKKLLLGSLCSVAILIIASLSSVASARATEVPSIIHNLRNGINDNEWEPGFLVGLIIYFLAVALVELYLYIWNLLYGPTGFP